MATTAHAADIARAVAGEGREVIALVPSGADPHDFEPRPQDVAKLAEADLIVRSGGEIDEWLDSTIEAAGAEAQLLDLSEAAQARADDPHWWQDPTRVVKAAGAAAGAIGDTASSAGYERELRDLDSEIETCLAQLEPDERKLVSTHDSLGYFAERYDLDVIGAVIPSRSTRGQASAGETAELVELLKREKVKAIFAEQAVPARVERAIADAADVQLGDPLWTDTLGPDMTYIQAMRENADAIARGLSGGRVSCPGT